MTYRIKLLLGICLGCVFMACAQIGRTSGYVSLSPKEFAEKITADPSAYVLDVRTPREYAEGHIAGAHNLDWLNQDEFKLGVQSLPKTSPIFVYCRSGRRSVAAAGYLSDRGYTVINLNGGYSTLSKYMDK